MPLTHLTLDLPTAADTSAGGAAKLDAALTAIADATNAVMSVLRGVPVNTPPTAKFTITAQTGLTVAVDGTTSSDPDGTVAQWAWDFGDGTLTYGKTSTHTYAAAGSYLIGLTVTDGEGLTGTVVQQITAVAPPPVTTHGDSGVNQTGIDGRQQSGTGITLMQNVTGSTFDAQANAAGTTAIVSLQAKAYTFADFATVGSGTSPSQFRYGARLTGKGLFGAGSKYTTVSMVAKSSKWASDVPIQGSGASNQLQAVFTQSTGFTIDGVKFVFTDQGHLYNGVRLEQIASPKVTNTTILAAAGNAGSPPGETFGGINFQRASGTATVTNVTVDGQNWAAAALGSNSASAHFIVTNVWTYNHPYSAFWASWQQTGQMDFYNCGMSNGARAFNAERLAATVNFYDPLFAAPMPGHSDVNPTYDGGYTGGVINYRFTTQANYTAYLANRGGKKTTAISNPSSVSQGLVKGTVVNFYIAGVLQTQSNFLTWSGI